MLKAKRNSLRISERLCWEGLRSRRLQVCAAAAAEYTYNSASPSATTVKGRRWPRSSATSSRLQTLRSASS